MKTAIGKTDYVGSTHRRDWSHLIGQKFNRWTVLDVLPELSRNGSVICRVQCSCEKHTIKEVLLSNLRSGVSRSCGCLRNEETSDRRTFDLTNRVFGHLTAIRKTGNLRPGDNSIMWDCICDLCGGHREVPATLLLRGKVIACEKCQRRIGIEKQRQSMTEYTAYERRITDILSRMIGRCHSPTNKDYLKYGARGIYVYRPWIENRRSFVEWSLANGYGPDLSIDRIDVNGPYAPWNCRWVDSYVQANNRRNNVFIESGGMRLTAAECSAITHKCASFFSGRPDYGKIYMDKFFANRDPNLPNALDVVRYRHMLEKFMENNRIVLS